MSNLVFALALMLQTAGAVKTAAPSKQWRPAPIPINRHSSKPVDPAPWAVYMRYSTLSGIEIGYFDQMHAGGIFEGVCSAGAPLKTFTTEAQAKAYIETCPVPK